MITLKTISGRVIYPPKIRVTSNIVAKRDSIRADEWLLSEAKKEAKIDFHKTLLDGIKPKKMSQADKDTAWIILTGNCDNPAVFELVQ